MSQNQDAKTAPPFELDEDEAKPVKITCKSTDCAKDLHCYSEDRRKKSRPARGTCQACGADLVDWKRVRRRDITDATYTFAALRTEKVRDHYWVVPLHQWALNHARRIGKAKMREAVEKQLRAKVGSAHPAFDRRQTPPYWKEQCNALCHAQHATASCCRVCIEDWHGIPQGRELTKDEIGYLTELVLLYIKERLPSLPDKAEKVPGIRKSQPKARTSATKKALAPRKDYADPEFKVGSN